MKSAIFARLFRIPFSTMKESVKYFPNFIDVVSLSILWQYGDFRCLHRRFCGVVYTCFFSPYIVFSDCYFLRWKTP